MVPFAFDIGRDYRNAKDNQNSKRNFFPINVILSLDCHDVYQGVCRNPVLRGPLTEGSRTMDIYLHLGAHRCANQTFHRFLETNNEVLSERGIAVWMPKRTRNGLMRGLRRAPEKITLEDERQAARSVGRMLIELARLEKQGRRALLISDPGLLGDLGDNLQKPTLYPLLQERLMRLQPVFAGKPLRIGLSIRSFEDYWTSALARRLSQGYAAPKPDTLDLLTTQPRHWRHVVGDVAAAFPDVQLLVWAFERMAGRPDSVLETLCGPSVSDLSYSSEWVGRSRDLNQLNRLMETCGQAPLMYGSVAKGTRWMPFSADQKSVLRAEYRRDLAWLQGGAQGHARYIIGRKRPVRLPDGSEKTHSGIAVSAPAGAKGYTDGIKKRMV